MKLGYMPSYLERERESVVRPTKNTMTDMNDYCVEGIVR